MSARAGVHITSGSAAYIASPVLARADTDTDLKLLLKAIRGLYALGRRHDACIADEDVERLLARPLRLYELAHAGQGAQVEFHELKIASAAAG